MKQHSSRQANIRKSRSGFTLIETLLIVTLTTALSIMGTKVILLLLEIDGKLAASTMVELTTQRFEDQLRNDAECSFKVDASDDELQMKQTNGEAITYRIETDRLIRTSNQSREVYRFPEETISFEVMEQQVAVVIKKNSADDPKTRTEFASTRKRDQVVLRATIARRLRHAHRTEATQ